MFDVWFRSFRFVVACGLASVALVACGGGPGAGGAEGAQDVLSSASGGDACATACHAMSACGFCIRSNGACASEGECTSICRGVAEGPQNAECVNSVQGCDASAIGACFGGPAQQPQQPQQGNAGNSQCNGCVWDGSACTWYSQSDWGQGDYSGAATSCDASCCPGHG